MSVPEAPGPPSPRHQEPEGPALVLLAARMRSLYYLGLRPLEERCQDAGTVRNYSWQQ